MNLAERLKSKSVRSETVVVDGDQYSVKGKSKAERGRLFARSRKKDGSIDSDKLEAILLEACVTSDDGSTATVEEWNLAPAHITGPLVAVIMSVCGLDKDDLDPKDSDSTES